MARHEAEMKGDERVEFCVDDAHVFATVEDNSFDILTTRIRGNRMKGNWKKRMSLHHWPFESYQRELSAANLQMLSVYDITPDVIRGFSCYKEWINNIDRRHFMEDMIPKLYDAVHARLNIYLLRTRRQYCVIVGKKPEVSL